MRKNYYLISEQSNSANLLCEVVQGRKEAIKDAQMYFDHFTNQNNKQLDVIKLNVNKYAENIEEEIERAIKETFDYGYTPIYTIGEFNG